MLWLYPIKLYMYSIKLHQSLKLIVSVLVLDIRVPLMWNEEEHFRAKESISGKSYNNTTVW